MTNFIVGQAIARSNNCRGLLIALGEADISALWPCRLSQGASERAIEISAFSCSCQGNGLSDNEIEPFFILSLCKFKSTKTLERQYNVKYTHSS